MTLTVRSEVPGDVPSIRALTDAAFRDMPFSNGTEGPLVDQLRKDGDLVLSLVATGSDEAVIGHIGFSPITISGAAGDWYQLSPVSVMPMRQKSGIGSELIEAGLERMTARGAAGIALVGDPAYYSRFGFTLDHSVSLSEVMDPVLQLKLLTGETMPSGQLTLAPAFG